MKFSVVLLIIAIVSTGTNAQTSNILSSLLNFGNNGGILNNIGNVVNSVINGITNNQNGNSNTPTIPNLNNIGNLLNGLLGNQNGTSNTNNLPQLGNLVNLLSNLMGNNNGSMNTLANLNNVANLLTSLLSRMNGTNNIPNLTNVNDLANLLKGLNQTNGVPNVNDLLNLLNGLKQNNSLPNLNDLTNLLNGLNQTVNMPYLNDLLNLLHGLNQNNTMLDLNSLFNLLNGMNQNDNMPNIDLNSLLSILNMFGISNSLNDLLNLAALNQQIKDMINALISQKLPGVDQATQMQIQMALQMYQVLLTRFPQLQQQLKGVNNIKQASQIISDFIKNNIDPSLDVYAILLSYYKIVAPQVQANLMYSQNVQTLIEKLIQMFQGNQTNVNVMDPNFYSNLFYLILQSGVLDFQSLMNPPTNVPTDIPNITIPNFDISLLFSPEQILPLLNDSVLVSHVQTFLPQLISDILKAQTPNDIMVLVEDAIKKHMTPDILERIKQAIKTMNSTLYDQIKNETNVDALYPYIMLYLESFVIERIRMYADFLGIKLPDLGNLFNPPTTPMTQITPGTSTLPSTPNYQYILQVQLQNMLVYLYADYLRFPNKTNADRLVTFETIFKGLFVNNPTALNALKLRLCQSSPQLCSIILNINDINTLYPVILPYLSIVLNVNNNDIQNIASMIGISLPAGFFGFLGTAPSPPPTTATTTIPRTTTIYTVPPQILAALGLALQSIVPQLANPQNINFETVFITSFNNPDVISILKERLKAIDLVAYNQVANITTAKDLYPYVKAYLKQLLYKDLDTIGTLYGIPANIMAVLSNLFDTLAVTTSTTTATTTRPPTTTTATTTRPTTTTTASTTPTTTTTARPTTTTTTTARPTTTTTTTTTRPTTTTTASTTPTTTTTARPTATTTATTTTTTTRPTTTTTTTRPTTTTTTTRPTTTTTTTRPTTTTTTTTTTTRSTTTTTINLLSIISNLSTASRTTTTTFTRKPWG